MIYRTVTQRLLLDGFSNDGSSSQTAENEQTAAEGGGSGSTTAVHGSDTGGVGDEGSGVALLKSNLGVQTGGRGNVDVTTISTLDPEVAEAALSSNVDVSNSALASNSSIANAALDDLESTATASINAGVNSVALNDQFGEAALDAAANAEADSTTALEATGTESETLANNALAAAQNETLAGVTPAQQFQSIQPSTPGTLIAGQTAATWATWISIVAGALAIYFYLTKKKA